jgi:hypothetical protein
MGSKRRENQMKIVKYFKLFESRTAEITDKEFVMLVKDNCKEYLANPKYLQRMKGDFNGEYSYIDPKQHVRKPLMNPDGAGVVSAHHTLLMENLPSWKSFPKRSESLIGSLKLSEDTAFGDRCYLVIPYDGARFGLAPSSDLWGSYCEVGNMKYEFDNVFTERFTDLDVSEKSYGKMMKDLQHYYEDYLIRESNKEYKRNLSYIDNIFMNFSSDGIGSVEEGFDKYFAPQKFSSRVGSAAKEFKSVGYDGLVSDDKREFWTDSKCFLVYLEDFGQYYDNNKMKAVATQKFSEVLKQLGVSDERIEYALKSVDVAVKGKTWMDSYLEK